MRLALTPTLLAAALAVAAPRAVAADDRAPLVADVVVDLGTSSGTALLGTEWRFRAAEIVSVPFPAAGPDHKPSGAPGSTHDLLPAAGAEGFDDSAWEVLDPATLETRRGTGKLSYAWYRLRLTVPEQVGSLPTRGTTAVLELVVDDSAEIWVDGRLPLVLGQTGGQLVKGWNAPQRVVLGRDLVPGQQIQVAFLAMNGPASSPPSNYIWIRSATVDFYRPGRLTSAVDVDFVAERNAEGLDAVVPPGSRLQRLATGFLFTEGPVWVPEGPGHLLFSDPNANVIYRWSEDDGVSIWRTKSGYKGLDIGEYGQPGSNGLALDAEGRVLICEHGNRRVSRLERNGVLTVLADRFEGQRLNSPNDLVLRSDGAIYFSDPPFGLPRYHDDPRRELDHFGVYCLKDGELRLVSDELLGPNGVELSPDERFLYVANWDVEHKVVMRYAVEPDGGLSDGQVFFDMGAAPEEEALDGLVVDDAGNLFVSGPGGVWILSPEGEHLGTLRCPELPANFAWGLDRRTLFLTARTGLYRLLLGAPRAAASAAQPQRESGS